MGHNAAMSACRLSRDSWEPLLRHTWETQLLIHSCATTPQKVGLVQHSHTDRPCGEQQETLEAIAAGLQGSLLQENSSNPSCFA